MPYVEKLIIEINQRDNNGEYTYNPGKIYGGFDVRYCSPY